MKKHLSLILLVVLLSTMMGQAKNTVVSSTTDFKTAWNAAQDGDSISVTYNDGVAYTIGAVNLQATGGCITLRAANPDSMPLLQLEIDAVALPEGTTCGLVFENLHLEYRSPVGTSGQIIYFKGVYANVSKLVFKGCEITRSVRSIFRSTLPTGVDANGNAYTKAGDVDYFEMSNCLIHNTTTTSGNNWPLIYFGHLPVELNFKNNTFYDMPYMKNIYTMNYATQDASRTVMFNFENNTVCLTGPYNGQAMINTAAYLSQESIFNIKNNILMIPNWENELNLNDTLFNMPKILSCRYGIIQASNNLIQGYQGWEAGQALDADGEGLFVALDTVPQYTMETLGVSWSDFANPEGGDYSYLYTNPLATAGSDGGPIGDKRWVLTYQNPRNLEVTADNVDAVVTPAKGVYEDATSITVSASDVVGYSFVNWQDTLGAVISTENPYTFSITGNTNLVAHYAALLTRAVTITMKGTKSATYTITPARTQYYLGDIITTKLNAHAVNEFLGWSDGVMTLTRVDTLNADLNVTAKFKQAPYMLAWDFSHLTGNNATFNSLKANLYADTLNMGVMNYVTGDTIAPTFQTRNNKFTAGELNFCALRRTMAANFANPDYLFVKFSTKGKTGVKVTSAIASDNCAYQVQKLQYSLDGKVYMDFASDSLPLNSDADFSKWYDLKGSLPREAENLDSVFVRWIADPSSTLIGVATSDKSSEYMYISKIVVLADVDMGGSSWRVSPFESYEPGQVISSVPGITLTLGGGTNVWSTFDTTFVFGNATYISTLNGTQNPVQGNNRKFSQDGIPPTVGAFYKFDVAATGTLDAAIIINANKASYIVENTTAMEGYSNFMVTVKTYANYTIPVVAGSSYYFFSEGSKMGIMGFVYTPNEPIAVKYLQKFDNQVYTSGSSLFVKAVKSSQAMIFDMMGKRVATTILNEGVNEISGLSKGMYIVRVGSENFKAIL